MRKIKNIVAFDCGNSSYRLVLAKYSGEKIEMEVIAQEKNDMVKVLDYYYWDILKIQKFFIENLKKVVSKVERIDSIGICTWGVDFALFDKQGNMINNPLSYRNEMGQEFLEKLSTEEHEELFMETGILSNRINSVYLLSAIKEYMPEIFNTGDKLLMMPDILNYFVTGRMMNEPSELSTTQLFDVVNKKIDEKICRKFGIKSNMFSELGVHGEKVGNLLPSIKEEIGIDYEIPIVCVPSHDTASAVVAIPAKEEEFAFISSGTWALIGAELDNPIINKVTMDNGFTNELGAFDKITLLKNSAGMFILERIKKEYDLATNRKNSWEDIIHLSKTVDKVTLIDINHARFFNPQNMAEEVHNFLKETNQYSGILNWGIIIKTVQESMACNYAVTISALEKVVGRIFDTIYLAGGGSRNKEINKLTAKYTEKKIVTCGQESTCLGNIGVQIKYFDPKLNLKEIRNIIQNSIEIEEYISDITDREIIKEYLKLLN